MRAAGIATGLYGWTERFRRDRTEWDWPTLFAVCAEAGVDAVEVEATRRSADALRALLASRR